MNTMMLLAAGGTLSMVMTAGSLLALRHIGRQKRVDVRIAAMRAGGVRASGHTAKSISPRRFLHIVSSVGIGFVRSGMLSSQTIDELVRKLGVAGIRGGNAVTVFVGCKVLLLVLMPLMVGVALQEVVHQTFVRNALITASAVAGLLLPDFVLNTLRKRYQKAIDRGLPDALDMMVMCAESGLSLEPTIGRVGTEIQPAHPEVAREFLLASQEFQMSADSHVVLNNLGERTGMVSIKRVVSTLSQTLQYGTPLSEALRVLSTEMRTESLTKFEEKAARLPVLLTVPMILFILPSLFLVVGGPAVMQVINLMRQ